METLLVQQDRHPELSGGSSLTWQQLHGDPEGGPTTSPLLLFRRPTCVLLVPPHAEMVMKQTRRSKGHQQNSAKFKNKPRSSKPFVDANHVLRGPPHALCPTPVLAVKKTKACMLAYGSLKRGTG